jgi:penicillin amidase
MQQSSQTNQTDLTARRIAPKQRRRWMRVTLRCAGGLLALVVVAVACFVLWLRGAEKAALPLLDGDVHLAGLSAPVTVRRDEHGVPHIEAASEEDLWVAQGYVTAQDRLWQMDAFRRNANGELAEVMGSSLVQHDTLQRVLGIRRTAERIWANSPADQRSRFEAYARGVNLYIAEHGDDLPAEFRLLGYKPKPWTGADSISVGLMMVQTLDMHWEDKLAREAIQKGLQAYTWKEYQNDPLHRLPDAQKLEADLYPVGSWRDHPPTGEKLDLSQPQPASPKHASDDDDEDDSSQADYRDEGKGRREKAQQMGDLGSGIRPAAEKLRGTGFVSGHGFSRADKANRLSRALAAEGWFVSNPSRLSPFSATYNADDPALIAADLRGLREAGLGGCAECAYGSNNWVVAGSHTASEKPLLSNDMHLGLAEPNIWYMADLKAPGFHATGVTLPGVPFVIEGHNEHVAWGFTALYADVQDLYIEKLDGKGSFENGGVKWIPLKVAHEVIRVRGGKDVTVEVQETDHGPLLNPILPKEKRAISLKWTLYDPSLNTLPVYEINKSTNWGEFESALKLWCWPTQNVVYADDQGHIAYHAIGKVPVRGPGFIFRTPNPHDVLNSRYEWGPVWFPKKKTYIADPYISFESMPHAFDPPSGFLATANSRVTPDPPKDTSKIFLFTGDMSTIPLTAEWAEPYRAERIYKLLDGRNGLTRADMLAVQTDIYSEVDQEIGHRLAYAVDHTDGVDERLKKAADLMRSWDGRLTTDSAAASVVTQAREAFWPLVLRPKLGKELASEYRWSESDFAEEEIIMHGGSDARSPWLPAGYKNWDALLTEAVRKGMEAGHAPGDVTAWRYGSWHVVDIEHPLASFLPGIGRMAGTGKQPLSGDKTTVKQVGRDFGPSQRFTMDWSDVDGSTQNIVLGESGDPYSPYYRDQWNDYYGGTTFPLPFSDAAVAAHTRHTLRLTK